MPAPQRKVDSPEVAPTSGGLGLLARVYWMLAGNPALGLIAALIATAETFLWWLDLAYWAVVSSLVAVRHADVNVLGGATAGGTPASRAHWRRYTIGHSIVCLAVWAAAHGAAKLQRG